MSGPWSPDVGISSYVFYLVVWDGRGGGEATAEVNIVKYAERAYSPLEKGKSVKPSLPSQTSPSMQQNTITN